MLFCRTFLSPATLTSGQMTKSISKLPLRQIPNPGDPPLQTIPLENRSNPPEAKRKPRAHETAFYTDRDRTAYAIIAFFFFFFCACIIYGCRTASLYPAAVVRRGSYTKEGVLI
ncbi:hypothetical protein CEXT_807811 [Caerostris extrusa]|uniref:Uncharacterized protein n=1 Tax=Caerostris extrusa TaxID=172846 RepID=A0AAV4V6U9_CAEEX|nr:hypothetical protein CEXT_807811 [Caerostris extrusa]